jgi:uncharacterized protein (UPF0335 family)
MTKVLNDLPQKTPLNLTKEIWIDSLKVNNQNEKRKIRKKIVNLFDKKEDNEDESMQEFTLNIKKIRKIERKKEDVIELFKENFLTNNSPKLSNGLETLLFEFLKSFREKLPNGTQTMTKADLFMDFIKEIINEANPTGYDKNELKKLILNFSPNKKEKSITNQISNILELISLADIRYYEVFPENLINIYNSKERGNRIKTEHIKRTENFKELFYNNQ